MVRKLRRDPNWSRTAATLRFEAKRVEIEKAIVSVRERQKAAQLEEQKLLSMLAEVVATLDRERGPRERTTTVSHGARAKADSYLQPSATFPANVEYAFDEDVEAWTRHSHRGHISYEEVTFNGVALEDPLVHRAAIIFGAPGLFHLLAVAEAAQQRIEIDIEAIPERVRYFALSPALASWTFSLSVFQKFENVASIDGFVGLVMQKLGR